MTAYDLVYATAIGLAAPIWLCAPKWRRKIMHALRDRRGDAPQASMDAPPAILIHAVSMGEINATTALVRMLAAAKPGLRFVISTTSQTGADRARQLYQKNPSITLIRYPFDFSSSVGRMLDAQRPVLAVLMELEVWPNFMLECARREIPVVLVNGRLSAHSFRGYSLLRPLTRRMFSRLAQACVQDEQYAERFERVGVPADRIRVTGTMKFDTAAVADRIEGAERLAAEVGLQPGRETIWVCGSTGPGEEKIILDVYSALLKKWPALRSAIIPRHPERFDEVAELIRSSGFALVRRSIAPSPGIQGEGWSEGPLPDKREGAHPNPLPEYRERENASFQAKPECFPPPIILGDTMGELRKFYSIADIVFVGRSLVDLGPKQHGSDMIEPAALGKPVVVGPFTGNFADVMLRFRESDAIREIGTGDDLKFQISDFCSNPTAFADMGRRAQDAVKNNLGATARHVSVILEFLNADRRTGAASRSHPSIDGSAQTP